VTGCSGALMREDERGKKWGGGSDDDGVPFIGDVAGVRDRPRAVPRGGEAWRGVVGPARRSGGATWPAAALTGGLLTGAA
jgi:hypothetical protein